MHQFQSLNVIPLLNVILICIPQNIKGNYVLLFVNIRVRIRVKDSNSQYPWNTVMF